MILVTGFPRAGTTLLYCMLDYAVEGYTFFSREVPELIEGAITKSPLGAFSVKDGSRCIVMIRDPRYLLTSRHAAQKFRNAGYFLSAHSSASDARYGLCEWWQAIKALNGRIVRYEDLVSNPRAVQDELGRVFGLRYRESFADFHRGKDYGEYWTTAMGGTRPVAARADYDVARVSEQFSSHPELYDVAAEMGYDIRQERAV